MRRSDREITDANKIEEILQGCQVCRVGYNDNGKIYIVPVNYGFEIDNGVYTLYFHGANEGRKIELAAKGGSVGFEMDADDVVVEGDIACNFTTMYKSIIGTGEVEVLTDREAKKKALYAIMRHYSDRTDFTFADKMLDATGVVAIKVDELTCKEHHA